ncbi:MAG: translocation/assembly module TamB domain-containing protein [Nitrospirae bacterium]|nr:translocation/assembly module TamB domain-containing protein [Nitrospirota bacterium]
MRFRLLAGAVVLLLLVLGAEAFLASGAVAERARAFLLARSEELFGEPVTIGRIHLSALPPQARLEDVRLPPVGDWFGGGGVQLVKVRLSLWSVVTGGIRAFDVTLIKPHFTITLPETTPETATLLPVPEALWRTWSAHRLTVSGGTAQVRRGDAVFDVDGIELAGRPDVTLRSYRVRLGQSGVVLDGQPLLDASAMDLVVQPDRVRIVKATFTSPVGRLALSGDARAEPGDDGAVGRTVVGVSTDYEGDLAGALGVARRLGVNAPDVGGTVRLSGRLYGPSDGLRWDGDLEGRGVGLSGSGRMLETASLRVRADRSRVEVVHGHVAAGGGELRATGHVTLADPPDFDMRVSAGDVDLGWLLADPGPYGTVSAEAHLLGATWPPLGTVAWQYRNDHAAADHPAGAQVPAWRRLAAKVVRGHGESTLHTDRRQDHSVEAETAKSRVRARATVTEDGALEGELTVHGADFADLGMLVGLDYVHGTADAGGRLDGTPRDFRIVATGTLVDGRVRGLEVGRLTGNVVVTPTRLVFRNVRGDGAGHMRLDGELGFPSADRKADGLTTHLAANLQGVALAPLVGLFHPGEPLELNVPASGRLYVVRRPGHLAVWGKVRTGAGDLYGQSLRSGRASLWIDEAGMVLTDARFDLSRDGVTASANGNGELRWADGRYRARLNTGLLPIDGIDILRENVPFLTGRFTGEVALEGDLDDPLLTARGQLRDFAFHGAPVGRGNLSLTLSGWQLRVLANLAGPGVGDADPAGRALFYARLQGDAPFAMAARLADADAVPWLRGLLPATDALVREQLGGDYGLGVSGRVSASGTLKGGPALLRAALTGATLQTGGLVARLRDRADLSLRGGVLRVAPMALDGDGLALAVAGSLAPDRRFDLKLGGSAAASWLNRARPQYGISGGAAGFDLTVSGDWDAPRLAGTVRPEMLAVAPPELAGMGARVTVSGTAELAGPLGDPALGAVNARFAPVALTASGFTVSAPELTLNGANGVFTMSTAEFAGPVGRLRVGGGWIYPQSVALEAVGVLRLGALVAPLAGLDSADGDVRVSGELAGPWQAPLFNGGAEMDTGRVRLVALDQVLRVTAASVLLSGERVVLDHLEGEIGGGRVAAQGSYQMDTQAVHGIVTIDRYGSRPFAGVSATVSGELALSGVLPGPTLSGDLHIHRALYDRRMQWGAWLVDMVSTGQQDVARVVPFGETRLAVRLYGNNNITVDNNLAKLALEADLLVTGSIAEPGLIGRVDVRSGEIRFREHVFELEHASLDFVHADRILPYLDVLAHTTVQHGLPDDPLRTEPVEVDLVLTGPADQLDLTLSSQPDLPQNDLLSLLAVGRTTEELAASGGAVGAGEATYLVTTKLQSQLEEQVQRFTGLDRFQVDPFYTDDPAAGSAARLTVGKRLFDGKGRITYSTVTDATQEPIINLSYQVGPRISLILEQDEEGRRGGEVRYRIRFR